jgi:sugar lactone lactonase YvrE
MATLTQAISEEGSNHEATRRPSSSGATPAPDDAEALFSFTGHPGGLAIDGDGAILVSDTLSSTIWRVTDNGAAAPLIIIPAELEHGWERQTRMFAPAGLAFAPDGSLFVADSSQHRVCAVSPDGSLRVVAGGTNGYRDGPRTEAMFRFPLDVALAADGTCYVADTGNDRIRAISPEGMVTTVAGSIYDYGDGHGTHARFRRPAALAVDAEATLYVADTGNNAIRRVDLGGVVTTLAGEPPGGERDGSGRNVGLRWPTGIATGADGSLWVADHGNGALRHITAGGESTTEHRLSGLRWPTAVALRNDGKVVMAGDALYDAHVPQACLMILGDAR